MGLLKSTMLQLDSSFTERDYAASSFRQFVEMLAKAHIVEINRVSGHYLVEIPRTEESQKAGAEPPKREEAVPALDRALRVIDENDLWGKLDFNAVKEYVQRVEPDFDEKRYGFGQFAELLNYAQDLGLVRLEPDNESKLRVYPGLEFSSTRPVASAVASALPAVSVVRESTFEAHSANETSKEPDLVRPANRAAPASMELAAEADAGKTPISVDAAAVNIPEPETGETPVPKPRKTYRRRTGPPRRRPSGSRKPSPDKT